MDGLNAIDLFILLLLVVSALIGIRNGFTRGAFDLLGLAAAFAGALVAYRPAAELVPPSLGLPIGVLQIGAFLVLLLAARAVLAVVETGLLRVVRPALYAVPLVRPLDHLLGLLPGLVRGAMISALVVLPFGILPFFPRLTDLVHESRLGSRLLQQVALLAPVVEARLGADLGAGFISITPPQEPGETVELPVRNPPGLRTDAAEELQMLQLLNNERSRAGLPPLVLDERLREVARGHSLEMLQAGYFAHDSPVHGSLADRLRVASIPYLAAGENLAFAPNVTVAHRGLMESPGHRANILSPRFGRVGIGVYRSDAYGRTYTQDFTN